MFLSSSFRHFRLFPSSSRFVSCSISSGCFAFAFGSFRMFSVFPTRSFFHSFRMLSVFLTFSKVPCLLLGSFRIPSFPHFRFGLSWIYFVYFPIRFVFHHFRTPFSFPRNCIFQISPFPHLSVSYPIMSGNFRLSYATISGFLRFSCPPDYFQKYPSFMFNHFQIFRLSPVMAKPRQQYVLLGITILCSMSRPRWKQRG